MFGCFVQVWAAGNMPKGADAKSDIESDVDNWKMGRTMTVTKAINKNGEV